MYNDHFSPKLAEYAYKHMDNRDGTEHYWTRQEVLMALEKMGKSLPADFKPCDAHYIANMLYADYFGSSLKTEEDVLKMTCDYMNDPDGYEGRPFYHYLTDVMVKGQPICWKDVI